MSLNFKIIKDLSLHDAKVTSWIYLPLKFELIIDLEMAFACSEEYGDHGRLVISKFDSLEVEKWVDDTKPIILTELVEASLNEISNEEFTDSSYEISAFGKGSNWYVWRFNWTTEPNVSFKKLKDLSVSEIPASFIDRKFENLLTALQLLAASGPNQLKILPKGSCKGDEIALNFDDNYRLSTPYLNELPDAIVSKLKEIDSIFDEMSNQPNCDRDSIWSDDALLSGEYWIKLRTMAKSIILDLNWKLSLPVSSKM